MVIVVGALYYAREHKQRCIPPHRLTASYHDVAECGFALITLSTSSSSTEVPVRNNRTGTDMSSFAKVCNDSQVSFTINE